MYCNRKQQPPPQPNAWQGRNPITQRASTHTPNGTEKPLPKPPQALPSKATVEPNTDKHAYDRALFILANFTVRLGRALCIAFPLCNGRLKSVGLCSILTDGRRATKRHSLSRMASNIRAYSVEDVSKTMPNINTFSKW